MATVLDLTPRAKRDTFGEGAERAWFYIAIWTVVPTQVVNWAAWRMGKYMQLAPLPLARTRLVICLLSTLCFFLWDTRRNCRARSGTTRGWQLRGCEDATSN